MRNSIFLMISRSSCLSRSLRFSVEIIITTSSFWSSFLFEEKSNFGFFFSALLSTSFWIMLMYSFFARYSSSHSSSNFLFIFSWGHMRLPGCTLR